MTDLTVTVERTDAVKLTEAVERTRTDEDLTVDFAGSADGRRVP